jgi:hypothetical protein
LFGKRQGTKRCYAASAGKGSCRSVISGRRRKSSSNSRDEPHGEGHPPKCHFHLIKATLAQRKTYAPETVLLLDRFVFFVHFRERPS